MKTTAVSMKKIVTLTLNPAFDLHCSSENFQPGHENLASVTDFEVGGKGVNISRALTANGVENLAVVVLGEENRADFLNGLQKDGLSFREIPVAGRIRENITLHDPDFGETRISFGGFHVPKTLLCVVEELLRKELHAGDFLTLTGRNPDGISMTSLKNLLLSLRKEGVHVVVDSRSFSLQDLIDVSPYLIKPNEEEILSYAGKEVKTPEEALTVARELQRKGIENVMLSLGSRGAVLATEGESFFVPAPKIKAISTIGAGDSSVAGFLAAAVRGADKLSCLKSAVAFGSAACLTPGTRPPRPEDVAKFR